MFVFLFKVSNINYYKSVRPASATTSASSRMMLGQPQKAQQIDNCSEVYEDTAPSEDEDSIIAKDLVPLPSSMKKKLTRPSSANTHSKQKVKQKR